jgi:SAM-dependent methyltransferase
MHATFLGQPAIGTARKPRIYENHYRAIQRLPGSVPARLMPPAMERDIQNFAPNAYAQSVPGMLDDQHRVLLSSLESCLSGREAPALLVLGCGGEVLPYSFQYLDGALGESNVERIHALIRDGRIFMLDLTDSEESGLRRSQSTLTHCGFFNPGPFHCCRAGGETYIPQRKVQAADYSPSSVIFLQQNLRDPLLIVDESIDAIDANLSLHHVTQTRECMLRVYEELYRVLKPGGLLHLGEGNVDMNYSEEKICRIGADLADILGTPVTVQDGRDPQYPYHYLIGQRGDHTRLHMTASPKQAEIHLSDEGTVHLPARGPRAAPAESLTGPQLMAELRQRGYRQALVLDDSVVLPLIDPLMDCDREGLIEPVDHYYGAAAERCRKAYSGKRDELVRQTTNAMDIERGRAARGIVEYYMGEPLILETLGKVGFVDIRVIRQSEPFYNIAAWKPAL